MPRKRALPASVQAAIDAATAADESNLAPRAAEIKLTLPFPPSVNNLYATIIRNGKPVRIKKEEGKWFAARVGSLVRAWLLEHGCRPPAPPYAVTLTVHPPKDGRKHDLDNLTKAVLDSVFATIREDDNDVLRIYALKLDPSPFPRVEVTLEGVAS